MLGGLLDNPLTDEQTLELNEIIKLPREQQAQRLQPFLKTLNEEQIEFLKKNQTQQCLFCGIALGNIKSYKIYGDSENIAVLDINPANKGHVLIIPKAHLNYSYNHNESIFHLANKISRKIKEVLNLDSNIFAANGENAGQKTEHLIVHVIPRIKNDKVIFNWENAKVTQEDLQELQDKLKIEAEIKKITPYVFAKENKRDIRIP